MTHIELNRQKQLQLDMGKKIDRRADRKTEKETWTMVRATEKRRKTNLKLPS